MAASFLLKFQEQVRSSPEFCRATVTKTSVKTEQPDEKLLVPLAATKTITEVKREQSDIDPTEQSYFAILR